MEGRLWEQRRPSEQPLRMEAEPLTCTGLRMSTHRSTYMYTCTHMHEHTCSHARWHKDMHTRPPLFLPLPTQGGEDVAWTAGRIPSCVTHHGGLTHFLLPGPFSRIQHRLRARGLPNLCCPWEAPIPLGSDNGDSPGRPRIRAAVRKPRGSVHPRGTHIHGAPRPSKGGRTRLRAFWELHQDAFSGRVKPRQTRQPSQAFCRRPQG